MTKAQLLFDPTAECEQFGLLPRGRNDLNAERLLIRLPRRRQGEHREDGGRNLAKISFSRHGARMPELRGNDDSTGTGFAFPVMSGGMLHG